MAEVENFETLVYQQTAAVAAEAQNAFLSEATNTMMESTVARPAPAAAPPPNDAPQPAPAAPAPENVVAVAMGPGPGGAMGAQQGDAGEAPEVPQIITPGDNAFRITRFQGSEQIRLGQNGPTMTLLPNGGYETDQAVRVSPVTPPNDGFRGNKPRMFMGGNGETQYSFRGGQWVIADSQGISRFYDGRNEYMLTSPANNPGGQRTQVFQLVTPR